jgi:hypothetical protein
MKSFTWDIWLWLELYSRKLLRIGRMFDDALCRLEPLVVPLSQNPGSPGNERTLFYFRTTNDSIPTWVWTPTTPGLRVR